MGLTHRRDDGGAGAALPDRLLTAGRPLVDLRDWWSSVREADLVGAALLSVALGGIILAFASADPRGAGVQPGGAVVPRGRALAAVLFALHNRRSTAPLVPHGAFAQRPAWGALVVSFFVGAALIAALVDIPIFARITIADGSQIKAALVLVEFLVALPVGALLGGVLTRRQPAGVIAGCGMVLAALGFWLMAGWGHDSLHQLSSSAVLAMPGSASASRSPRSTPRCSRARPTRSTASPARCSWWPGWSACWSASPR